MKCLGVCLALSTWVPRRSDVSELSTPSVLWSEVDQSIRWSMCSGERKSISIVWKIVFLASKRKLEGATGKKAVRLQRKIDRTKISFVFRKLGIQPEEDEEEFGAYFFVPADQDRDRRDRSSWGLGGLFLEPFLCSSLRTQKRARLSFNRRQQPQPVVVPSGLLRPTETQMWVLQLIRGSFVVSLNSSLLGVVDISIFRTRFPQREASHGQLQ